MVNTGNVSHKQIICCKIPTSKNLYSKIMKAIYSILLLYLIFSCKKTSTGEGISLKDNTYMSCHTGMPQRFSFTADTLGVFKANPLSLEGMIKINGGEFLMGAHDQLGRPDEYPQHSVKVSTFYMDITEVTNVQFRAFVKATGYKTTAEKAPDWEQLKKQLPPGTPKPADSLLVASSLVFHPTGEPVPLNNASLWWRWTKGADWQHPEGPHSSIKGRDNYPVVHISWNDANAYAKWAGKRLPTEVEWECASRGGLKNQPYPWGKEEPYNGKAKANTWDGQFPYNNTTTDRFKELAPVKSYAANGYGLYDMAGNVWEWCSDNYRFDYYQSLPKGTLENLKGPKDSYDPHQPGTPVKVIRGGSFLCNETYCSGYRVSSRMMSSPDTGLQNTGFRCVADNK